MKVDELRSKNLSELKDILNNLKKEAMNLRFQKVSGELEKTSRVRDVRRSIARVLTLIGESQKSTGGSGNA